jgi:hypothetical protein
MRVQPQLGRTVWPLPVWALMLEVHDDQGALVRYVTATEAPEWLGDDVTSGMVAMWRHRHMITPYRVGREVYYRLDELREVEQVTREAPQSHRRGGLDQGRDVADDLR